MARFVVVVVVTDDDRGALIAEVAVVVVDAIVEEVVEWLDVKDVVETRNVLLDVAQSKLPSEIRLKDEASDTLSSSMLFKPLAFTCNELL